MLLHLVAYRIRDEERSTVNLYEIPRLTSVRLMSCMSHGHALKPDTFLAAHKGP